MSDKDHMIECNFEKGHIYKLQIDQAHLDILMNQIESEQIRIADKYNFRTHNGQQIISQIKSEYFYKQGINMSG